MNTIPNNRRINMNTKLFKLLTAGTFALLSSCGDSIVDASALASNPVQTEAKLTVIVKDEVDGTLLNGTTVTLLSNGENKQTQNGAAVFGDVQSGTHGLLVEKDGYAKVLNESASIDASSVENIYVAKDTSISVFLPPLKASLEGYLLYPNKDGINLPAPGVSVQLRFGTASNLVKKIYDAKGPTDANGKFVFENLPATSAAYSILVIGTTIDGIPFQTSAPSGGGTAPSLSNVTASFASPLQFQASNNTATFYVTSYNEVVEKDAPVIFNFSDAINKATLLQNTISLNNTELADIAWDDDGRTATLTPASGWKGNFTVTILASLKSASGKTLNGASNATYSVVVKKPDLAAKKVNLSKAAVSTFIPENYMVQYNDGPARLVWDRVEGAEGYYVYAKVESANGYVLAATKTTPTDTTHTQGGSANISVGGVNYIVDNEVNAGRSVKFKVVAYNSQTKTLLEGADSVTIKDNVKPITNYQTTYSSTISNGSTLPSDYGEIATGGVAAADAVISTKDLGLSANMNEEQVCFATFREPMNVKATLTPTVTPALPAGMSIKLKWTNDRNLCYLVTTGATVPTVSSVYKISGLTDKAGNKLYVKYTGLSGTPSTKETDVLEMRITN